MTRRSDHEHRPIGQAQGRRDPPQPAPLQLRRGLGRRTAQPLRHGHGARRLADRAGCHGDQRASAPQGRPAGAGAAGRQAPDPARDHRHGGCPARPLRRHGERRRPGRPVPPLAGLPLLPVAGPDPVGPVRAPARPVPQGQEPLRPPDLHEEGEAAHGRPGPIPRGLRARAPRRLPVGRVRPPGQDRLPLRTAARRVGGLGRGRRHPGEVWQVRGQAAAQRGVQRRGPRRTGPVPGTVAAPAEVRRRPVRGKAAGDPARGLE